MTASVFRFVFAVSAYLGSAVAIILFTRNILHCFMIITLGGPGLGLYGRLTALLSAAELNDVASPLRIGLWALAGLPGVVVAERHLRLGGTSATRLELAYGLGMVAACSYRFSTIVVGVLALVLLRGLRRHPEIEYAIRAIVVVLALTPADVSLRARPGRPHFAQAISGTWGIDALQRDDQGLGAIVAGDEYLFLVEPLWLFVW